MANPFINNSTTSELGQKLFEIQSDSSYGNPISMIYYSTGIPSFDSLLNGAKFYEFKYTFHIIAYEKAMLFTLRNSKEEIFCALKRENITKCELSGVLDVDVVTQNKATNMLKSGAFGGGLIGSIASIGIGHISEKISGIKTKKEKGVEFYLSYNDEDEIEKNIIVYAAGAYADLLFAFLSGYYTKELPDKMKKPIDQSSSCYIATICYKNNSGNELIMFRKYRDEYLLKNTFGKIFTKIYYKSSPILIRLLLRRPIITKNIKRYILNPIYLIILNKYKK
ncbi:MAG: CFI-box-CTERM domain-containing protein [Bacteroidia bacterium]